MKNPQKYNNVCLAILFILAAGYVVMFAYVLIMKYYTFNPSYTVDGMSVRIVKNFLAAGVLQPYSETTKGINYCLLLYPVSILAIPLFFLFSSPQWVMIAHVTIIAAAVFPLYYLCRQILSSKLLSLAVVSSYLLHPYINILTLQGFRVPAIAIPLLFGLCCFMYKRDKRKSLIFLILSNLVIINVVWMTAILAGAFYMIRKCPLDKLVFKISVVWCIVILVAVSSLFILNKNTFPAGYIHLDGYGHTLGGVVKTIIFHPALVVKNITRETEFFLMLFVLSPGIFSLFSWPFLLPAMPETAFTLFAGNKISTISLIFPFLFLSAVCGLSIVRRNLSRLFTPLESSAIYGSNEIDKVLISCRKSAAKVPSFLTGFTIDAKLLNVILAVFIFSAAAIIHYHYSLPQMEEVAFSKRFDFNKYKMSRHAYVGHYVLGLLPKDAACLVMPAFVNHLYDYKNFGQFPYDLEKYNWDYIVIDTRDGSHNIGLIGQGAVPESGFLYKNALKKLLARDSGYNIYLFIDDYLMLKKGPSQHNRKKVIDYIINKLDS